MSKTMKMLFIILILISCCYASPVSAACTISTTPVRFGSYNVFSSTPSDATGSISVKCNERPPPTVTISIGQSPNSGGFTPRKMKLTKGTELIEYNLFIDTNRTTIWGDGSGSTSTVRRKHIKKKPVVSTVYGRIPPLQDVKEGSYTETLTVTIVW